MRHECRFKVRGVGQTRWARTWGGLHAPILTIVFPCREDRRGGGSPNLQTGCFSRIIGYGAQRFLQSRIKTHFRLREQSDQRGVCGAGDGGLD